MKKIVACLFLLGCLTTAVSAQLNYEGVLLISEVAYDSPGDDSQQEWFEIVNVGTVPLSLDGIRIGDEENSGDNEGMLRFPEGAVIEAEQALIIAQTASGFRGLFGFNPNFEIVESDTAVPNMRRSLLWATGDVALSNDGDELLLLQENVIIDAINYEEKTTFFAPSIGAALRGQSIERHPANCDSNSAADWQTAVSPTPGFVTFDDTCREPINPASLEALPTIGDIQGEGEQSPFVNQEVSFRGVMTGQHADTNAAGVTFYTIFVQDLVGFEDGNLQTSDGIAVFLGRERPFTQIGDQLRITGQVTEFFGLTEIDDDNLQILVESSGNDLPSPIALESVTEAAHESLEAMRVSIAQATVVGPTFLSCGLFVDFSNNGRAFQREEEVIVGKRPFPILNHQEADCAPLPQLQFGDQLQALEGPLTYHFDQFKLLVQPESALVAQAEPLPPLPQIEPPNEQQITITTFNFLNHFDELDDTQTAAEPKFSPEEIAVKEQKIAFAIANLLHCPTVIGVQEVEKAALLHALAERLSEACSFTYAVSHLESADVRGIDVALLSNPHRVEVLDVTLLQTCTAVFTEVNDPQFGCDSPENPLFSRPPLRVVTQIDGQQVTFVVNHFKSKREGEGETAVRRQTQAQFLNDWVGEQLAIEPLAHIVVLGDFNDFEASQTMALLQANGRLSNALLTIPPASRYTFSFGGVSQLIDGILLSPSFAETAVFAQILHVNADYPFALATDLSAEAIGFRSSDHDLPLVWVQLPKMSEPMPTSTPDEVLMAETAVAPTPPATAPTEPPSTSRLGLIIGGITVALFAILGLAMARFFRQANKK